MEKEQKQELGWRVSVLPIPAFHHCEPLCVACTQCTVDTAVSTRHFHIIRSVKIIYGNHILLVQGFEQDVFAFVYTLF